MIEIELQAPARVDGRSAPLQSLWFLLRLWCVATGADPHSPGWLRAAQVRERFCTSRSNPRMLVSRAFADFERWGVRVGWGTQPGRPLSMLVLAGRSRGPFWLAEGEAARLRIRLAGADASVEDVLTWLECPASSEAPANPSSKATDAAYWHAWGAAKRDMLQGRLIVDGRHGALSGYRLAQGLAGEDAYLEALALLQQAMVWRRAGNADAARRVLGELDRHWHDVQAPEHAWLGAMAAIVSAWCAYADRDPLAARQILRAASVDPRWAMLFQHHPRVRSEHANLQALIQRAGALDPACPRAEREQAAAAAVSHYRRALALACEAELFDAAASTASNLGWSLWLFRRNGLQVMCGTDRPLRWIALADALSRQHGPGSGSWNTIYLLRMVRDGGPDARHPDLDTFRRWPVMAVDDVQKQVAPVPLGQLDTGWRELAVRQLAAVDAGRVQVDALQRANLLLEAAWYEAHDGDLARAARFAARLRRRLRELLPVDRGFFRNALRCLPDLGRPVPAGASDSPASGVG